MSASEQASESARAANFKLSQLRATAVGNLLQQRLAVLGVTRYTLFTTGNVVSPTETAGEIATDNSRSGRVIATLT